MAPLSTHRSLAQHDGERRCEDEAMDAGGDVRAQGAAGGAIGCTRRLCSHDRWLPLGARIVQCGEMADPNEPPAPITAALHSAGVVSRSPYPGVQSVASAPLPKDF